MANPPESQSPHDWARYYADYGLCVVPAATGRPKVKWKQYQTEQPSDDQLQAWFRGESLRSGNLQLYVVCGRISNVVVLDCDSAAAERWWQDVLGEELMAATAHAISGSGRGHHYWFRLGEQDVKGSSRHTKGDPDHEDNWDLRGEGGGVVVPPSGHRSGGTYEWIVPLAELRDWPYPEILHLSESEGGLASSGVGSSTLAGLLAAPGEGGRNNWVTKVLGHYAKSLRFEDGFRATAEMVWALASGLPNDHPYERAEFDRTTTSIWNAEHNREQKPAKENGWLVGTGSELITICGKGDDVWLSPWSNFDIKAKSLIVSEDSTVSYIVDVHVARGDGVETIKDANLPGEKLGSSDQLSRWMAARRMVMLNPKSDNGINIKASSRLQQYMDNQGPRAMQGTPWMGWVDLEGEPVYVCDQGVITADSVQELGSAGVMPDPRKAAGSEAVWNYGFDGTSQEAAAVLREVLTFHDETVTALFGSIWALAPIKGAIMKQSSLFPHMAVIAPSEAGKTNGFFDLMLQANGRLNSGATYTPASLRDDLARHRGGFVWIDDPANIDDLGDLLRAAAGEGVHTRKGGANWEAIVRTHLVAPIVISAEGLDMLSERAMADRVIQFEVPNPTGRRSRKGDYQQWDDITALTHSVGHLSRFAGHYVQRAWQWLQSIGGQDGLRSLLLTLRIGSGRAAEKIAVVRAGARCLSFIAELDNWIERSVNGLRVGGGPELDLVALVDEWAECEGAGETGRGKTAPYLVEVVIPALLAEKGFVPSFRSAGIEPIFMDRNGRIRLNVPGVAQLWQKVVPRRQDRARASQLGSLSALQAEAKMINLGKSIPVKGRRYQILPEAFARQAVERAGFDFDQMVAEVSSHELEDFDEAEQGVLDS